VATDDWRKRWNGAPHPLHAQNALFVGDAFNSFNPFGHSKIDMHYPLSAHKNQTRHVPVFGLNFS
jgi:hypothetical protein